MAIKIPVSADFDAAGLKQQIQQVNDQIRILANQVGMANKQKFEPINLKSKEDLDYFIKQTQKLLKIQTELGQQMQKTGQGGKNPVMANWDKLYGDQAIRIKKMQSMLQFLGVEFNDIQTPKPKTPAGTPSNNAPTPQRTPQNNNQPSAWSNHLNTMLRSAGPVGGTVGNAISTGMSSGAGAGVMGLVGGLAALGVGKVIGAIADKIGQAQDNAIGLDKLYRQIGGVVSYSRLGHGLTAAADTLGMTNAESISMASAYSRAANLQLGQNLGTGMLVSGGLARSYGLDPNNVADTMGQLSATHVVNNDQQLRRMGMLMGEAIGKSGAFAQAGDAMQAISDFATQQARLSLTMPNVPGYAGSMAGLMSSGTPGMDLQGVTGLLNRVNASLQRGGSKGDASQMFMARIGLTRGINNPLALEALESGGAFGTINSTLGPDSLYGKRFGGNYRGDETLLDMTRKGIHRYYGNGPDSVVALARHLGINVNEAMALDNMSSRDMNGVSNRLSRLNINQNSVNATSYATLGQIQSGKGLESMGNEYLKRGGLSAGERQTLTDALKGTDAEKLKDVLTQVAATHGAAKTEGSEIRDSMAQLNNTVEGYARQALPALNIMRMAMVKMAGGSEASLRSEYMSSEMTSRSAAVRAKYAPSMKAARDREAAAYARYGAFGGGEEKAAAGKRVNAIGRQMSLEIEAQRLQLENQVNGAPTTAEAALNSSDISSPAAAAADGSGASTNLARGNPGNVKALSGKYASYGSNAEGIAGSVGQMLRYRSGAFRNGREGKKTTLRSLLGTYAPASDNNDVGAYTKFVASRAGINPDKEIDLRDEALMAKISKAQLIFENRKNAALPKETIQAGVHMAMTNPNNFTKSYPMQAQEHNINVNLHYPDGRVQKATTTSFTQPNSWNNRER